MAKAFAAGVTPEGFQLFQHLSKTIGNTVVLEGQSIVVGSDAVIVAPYKAGNTSAYKKGGGKNKETSVTYVQQLVQRFWSDATANEKRN